MTLLLVISFLFLLSLCVLLRIAQKYWRWYAFAKGVTSLLFVGFCAAVYYVRVPTGKVNYLVLFFALSACATGDILLGLANKKKPVRKNMFLAGAFSFSLAHLLFCTVLYRLVGIHWWDAVLAVALVAGIYLLEKKNKIQLTNFKIFAYIYSLLVGVFAAKSLQLLIYGDFLPAGRLLPAIGGLLFLVSDCVLLFLYFGVQKRKWYRYINLATYYCGIYLFAVLSLWI